MRYKRGWKDEKWKDERDERMKEMKERMRKMKERICKDGERIKEA